MRWPGRIGQLREDGQPAAGPPTLPPRPAGHLRGDERRALTHESGGVLDVATSTRGVVERARGRVVGDLPQRAGGVVHQLLQTPTQERTAHRDQRGEHRAPPQAASEPGGGHESLRTGRSDHLDGQLESQPSKPDVADQRRGGVRTHHHLALGVVDVADRVQLGEGVEGVEVDPQAAGVVVVAQAEVHQTSPRHTPDAGGAREHRDPGPGEHVAGSDVQPVPCHEPDPWVVRCRPGRVLGDEDVPVGVDLQLLLELGEGRGPPDAPVRLRRPPDRCLDADARHQACTVPGAASLRGSPSGHSGMPVPCR